MSVARWMERKRVRRGVVEDEGGMVDGSRGSREGNLMGVGGGAAGVWMGGVVGEGMAMDEGQICYVTSAMDASCLIV